MRQHSQRGFTLLELILVIALMAVISTLAVSRVDSITGWKYNRDVRKFISLWEFLNAEAISRRETYRLYLDFEKQSYYVRRELPPERNRALIRDVDYLSNLRTKGEKERREKEKEEEAKESLEEEFAAEDQRQTNSIEEQFYQFYFNDAGSEASLSVPLEFPSLAEEEVLTDGLKFKDIKIKGETIDSGTSFIRFSSRGMSDFAIIHISIEEDKENQMTILMDPASNKVALKEGYINLDFDELN